MSESERHILAIDTCGPAGSVALGCLRIGVQGGAVEILAEAALEGRTYSAMLVGSIDGLLTTRGLRPADLAALVVVSGPGSFTGVRVGLATAKGLAEPARIPVVAVSRLAVLAAESGVETAALDAHRHEVFLRYAVPGKQVSELLAGAGELAALAAPGRVAVCDPAAATLLGASWPLAEIVERAAPDAAGALRLALPRLLAGEFDDLLQLDGHYLRRSDAEIFGDPATAPARR